MFRKFVGKVIGVFLFVVFGLWSVWVASGKVVQWDFDMTVKIQNRILSVWDWELGLFGVLASVELASVTLLISLIFFRNWRLRVQIIALYVLGLAIEILGKLLIFHPAPPFMFYRSNSLSAIFPSDYVHTDYSYPSGHAYRATLLAIVLLVLIVSRASGIKKSVGLIIVSLWCVCVMVSRISLGEHWTSDVVGGIWLGLAMGWWIVLKSGMIRQFFLGGESIGG